eukprot:s170_g1.t2
MQILLTWIVWAYDPHVLHFKAFETINKSTVLTELQVDLAELHETFAAAPTQAIKTKIRARRKEILPRGIAQNVAIALARLGQGATENLAAALRALSGEGASLGVPADEVSRLLEVWPDEKVLAPLKDFALSEVDPEPLRDVEKQLLPLLVIPRVRQRLRLLVLADTAEKRVGEALDQLQLLRRACYEIQNSSLLRELLAIIVLLFNYVNFGAAPEKAQVTSSLKGVDVPSLLRLRETKASKGDFPGFHMLHFVVKQLLKQRASWKKEKVDERCIMAGVQSESTMEVRSAKMVTPQELERILRMSMEGLSIGLIAKLFQMSSREIHQILEDAWLRGAQEPVRNDSLGIGHAQDLSSITACTPSGEATGSVSFTRREATQELPSLRRACKVHMERLNSELQELKGDYFFVQTEFQEHREEYHGSDSSDEEVEPSTEHPNWGFLDKLLARGLDFANLAEAWLRGDEVLGRPYHPSVGSFAAFDSLQGEDGSAPPGWLWLCRPSGRWQRCWSEVRGPVLVLYKVELHHCTGATYVTLPGALLADGNKEETGKDEALLGCQEGDSEDSVAPKDGASFELITAGSNGRLLRLCASSRKQAASWRRVIEQVSKRPGAGYLTVSGVVPGVMPGVAASYAASPVLQLRAHHAPTTSRTARASAGPFDPRRSWRLCSLPLLFSAGRRLLRTPCADARWSSYNAGHGVELNDEETMAKRVDHYGRAEGHCIVVSETPVKSKHTASGRDFYAEIKMESLGDWS